MVILILRVAVACVVLMPTAESRAPIQNSSLRESIKAVSPVADDDAALRRVSEEWMAAYNAKDAARVASLYIDGGYYLSAHVLAHGREAIRAYFQKGIDAGGHIEAIHILETHSDAKLAYSLGRYEANNAGQKVDGRILLVLERRGDRWLIAAHEVVVRDQPE
jgi:uncharacterized protein (TIGR02246 family)